MTINFPKQNVQKQNVQKQQVQNQKNMSFNKCDQGISKDKWILKN